MSLVDDARRLMEAGETFGPAEMPRVVAVLEAAGQLIADEPGYIDDDRGPAGYIVDPDLYEALVAALRGET